MIINSKAFNEIMSFSWHWGFRPWDSVLYCLLHCSQRLGGNFCLCMIFWNVVNHLQSYMEPRFRSPKL